MYGGADLKDSMTKPFGLFGPRGFLCWAIPIMWVIAGDDGLKDDKEEIFY